MKIKSVNRTANCAWSPKDVHCGIFLAAGTTAQQVDASFNTSSQLEILSFDVTSPDKGLKPVAQTSCEHRFHKIVWGPLGIQQGNAPLGVLCTGIDNGSVQVFNVQRLLDNQQALLAAYKTHSGPVHSLDMNPFQYNLLASGSRESEVYIWDLSSPTAQPYTPGTPCQPKEDVVCLSWNRQVQHILASAMTTRCVVWDLRKSEPIIRVGESSSRFRCKAVTWNPQVATQLCLASEDDHTPWLQIWDLRYASWPVKTLEKHRKGILSLDWNPKDQDMLLSCGKDSLLCIWNPNGTQGSELISEIHTSSDWNFEAQWCPRNPALVSTASFSGELAVYSVIGGEQGGAGDGGLKKAPSWLSGGVGAQFGFGGKLITFSKEAGSKVDVAQVVTDEVLIERVKEMDEALFKPSTHDFDNTEGHKQPNFWQKKLVGEDSRLWQFIQALCGDNRKSRLQELLGYPVQYQGNDLVEDLADAFDETVQVNGGSCVGETASTKKIGYALVSGDARRAAELCLHSKRFAEALFLADYAHDTALKESVRKEFLNVYRADSMCRLIACVSSGLWEELTELAPVDEWQTTLAAILGHVTADTQRAIALCSTVAGMLVEAGRREEAMLAYLLARDPANLVECYLAIRNKPETNEHLQTFMEVITAARIVTGVQQLPKSISPIVAKYVGLLAEQGCLPITLHYLDDLDDKDAKMIQLRDRILQSQSVPDTKQHLQQQGINAQQKQNQFSIHGRNRDRTVSGSSGFDIGCPRPSTFQPMAPGAPASMAGYPCSSHNKQTTPFPSAYPDVNSNLPITTSHRIPGPISSTQEISPPPVDRVAPRPLSRAAGKYPAVVDPSIKNSGSAYGNYGSPYTPAPQDSYATGYNPVSANQYNPYLNSRSGTPAMDHYNAQYVPASLGAGGRSAFDSYPTAASTSVAPVTPMAPSASKSPLMNLPSGNDYTRDERYSAPGWNDPPPLRRSSKPLSAPPIIPETTCAPLTRPLPEVPATPGVGSSNFYSPQQQHIYQQHQTQQQQTTGTPSILQPQIQSTIAYNPAVQPTPQLPLPPVEKPPIPPQYKMLYDTFDHLRIACLSIQNNLVQKKMEDITKKIWNLGDKLRASEITETTISNLQIVAEAVTRHDYPYALQAFNYLAQTSNLTETSAFLPGIKTLLAIAQQNQIYA
ncbi:protein transport protein Sec31A-like [Varroa jacobsoni]|uniref:protein transport protein Sec31A-like n=1 Tax=Varroa jacobsoni TaxID=62625 RepID=UPI000BF68251|nr:protein transport protein Sec31A-like [Varroa jacobsoni]XP_022686163.1 protein transport protein Sec31A-like [Varroa jacobsoni]